MAERYMGGQAVIEGVMMRGADTWAVAVRRPDGEIALQVNPAPTWAQKWSKIPLVRGVVALVESMSLGLRALSWSAAQNLDEEEQEEISKAQLAGTMALALVLFTGLFMLLPGVITKSGERWLDNDVSFNLFEGLLKMSLFLGYLLVIGRLPDIKRVFQYHGAEHKAIAAYENGVALTPEEADRYTTLHVRCGTNFLLIVMTLSIVSHTLFGRPGWAVLIASRVLLIPVVAGVSYELIRLGAKYVQTNRVVRLLMAPGLALQRLTTREPTLDQLEVAIASLRAAMTADQLAEVDARVMVPASALSPPRLGLASA